MAPSERKLLSPSAAGGPQQYLVLDTNVLLHQLDLLEHCAAHPERGLLTNLIVLQTVLDEVRGNSVKLYHRARAFLSKHPSAVVFANEHHRLTHVERLPGESANDRNDRAIRVATGWYARHLASVKGLEVKMMSNDRASRAKARTEAEQAGEQIQTISVPEWVAEHSAEYPDLSELLARMEAFERSRSERGTFEYPEHLSPAELQAGLQSGRIKKGTFRVGRDYGKEASVTVRSSDGAPISVLISGLLDMNRAIDGDIVAVEMFTQDQWKAPSTQLEATMEEDSMVVTGAGASELAPAEGTVPSESGLGSVTPAAGAKPTGKVVGIVQRNWRSYCGSIDDPSVASSGSGVGAGRTKGTVLFTCVNRLIPRILLSSSQLDTLADKRIMVTLDSWPRDSRFPLGHYTRTLGPIGDRDTETQVLLIEHDIPTSAWSKAVIACLPKDEHNIDPSQCAGRSDFRNLNIFSIDPPGCTDIDDALHCRKLPNGNFELGVHIADVGNYVLPETAIDLEAANRGTSVYLVDRRIDMLPSKLSTNLCSLRAGIDRLTFSVLWEMTPEAEIVDTTFHKAVIRSVAAMTYQQAQERMDLPDSAAESDAVTAGCKQLRAFARILKAERIRNGALMLASAEVKFLLDKESSTPLDVEMYQLREANSVVEEVGSRVAQLHAERNLRSEAHTADFLLIHCILGVSQFMLLANISVGKRILEHYPTFALLRRHPVPSREMFQPLIRAARAAGFEINVDSSKKLADSLDRCIVPGFPFFNKLIRMLATRWSVESLLFASRMRVHKSVRNLTSRFPLCVRPLRMLSMTQAIYFSSGDVAPREYWHYGLACGVYTHFTSPIRRYADIVVHRLLASSLGLTPLPAAVQDRARVHEMADVLNHRHRMAQLVSRASGELYTLLFFQGKDLTEKAMVTGLKANGIRVMVPRYGIEAAVTLWNEKRFDEGNAGAVDAATRAENKNPWVLDEEALTLRGPGGKKFKVFEEVVVRIRVQEGKAKRKWLQVDLADKDAPSAPAEGLGEHIAAATASTKEEGEAMDTEETKPKAKQGRKRDVSAVDSTQSEGEVEQEKNSGSVAPAASKFTSQQKKGKAKPGVSAASESPAPKGQPKKKQRI